jgi:hypothetical protein
MEVIMAHTSDRKVFGLKALQRHASAFGLAGGLALAVLSTVNAQDSGSYRGSQDDQQACTDDVFRVCGDFVPDQPRIIACMKINLVKLSPACKAVFMRDAPPPPAHPKKRRRST